MRWAIYARYSSDRQAEHSIEDQVRLCRDHVERAGGSVAGIYTDAAISGASAANRPGLRALLEDARAGRFEAVIAEALDRLSRDQEDTAGLFKRLGWAGVRLVTASEGEIGALHVGLKGTMNALFLQDLADKVRRGQRGRVAAGRSPGGLPYGYRVVRRLGPDGEPVRGERAIDADQAAVVRRIFAEYGAGRAPRAIARDLNAEGIRAPRGGQWNASTIVGSRSRANGILNNPAYRGLIVYGRQKFAKDPDTGRRVGRPAGRAALLTVEAPGLRIVDEESWARAEAIKAALAPMPPHARRRPKRLLSGLLRCGHCGGAYVLHSAGRVACANHKERGTCANGRQVAMDRIEAAVLAALRDRLLDPDAVAAFVRTYNAERRRLAAEGARRERTDARRLAELDARLRQLVTAIEEGAATPTTRQRLFELEAEKAALQARAAVRPAPVVTLHPNAGALYRREVERLQAALNEAAATRVEAAQILRRLVDRVVIHPLPQRGRAEIEIHGLLAEAFALANGTGTTAYRQGVKMVAGAGFAHYPLTTVMLVKV